MLNKLVDSKNWIFLIFLLVIFGCTSNHENERLVEIQTDFGKIVLKLYNQTPKHRDNFIKLIESGFYDSLTFHRVIKNFVIQGGDPMTRGYIPDSLVGENDSGNLIDAEIIDTIYHKKGALGMAREGDDINPEKKSSGSQFYIVVGKVFSDSDIFALEEKVNKRLNDKIRDEIKSIKISELIEKFGKIDTLILNKEVNFALDSIFKNKEKFKLNPKQKTIYKSLGGLPHLDGNYTVFGEVVKGIDVVEKISQIKTNNKDIPINPIRMKINVIK